MRHGYSELLQKWNDHTITSSSMEEICRHPIYSSLVEKGKITVTRILEDMSKGHVSNVGLFRILKEITGACPVAPNHMGDIKLMMNDWVAWGKDNGYL